MKKIIFLFPFFLLLFAFSTLVTCQNLSTSIVIKQSVNSRCHENLVEDNEFYEVIKDEIIPEKPQKVAGSSQTVAINITAGSLESTLSTINYSLVTSLIITGTIDARDFKTLKDYFTNLSELDISDAKIEEYYGKMGTADTVNTLYPENTIPAYAFGSKIFTNSNKVLSTIKVSKTITAIGDYAFQYCSNLSFVNIPESVITIGRSAFYNCKNLTVIEIPANVSTIGDNAFLGDYCLINVDPNNLTFSSIDGVLFNKNQTVLIKYPLSKVGAYSIPSSVTTIYNLAFFGCNQLTEITIPLSVTSFGNQAFSYCKGINSFYVPATVTTMGGLVFMSSSCSVNVDEDNPMFSSADGLLFNKDKSTLIYCPTSKYDIYTIPATVTTLSIMAFQNCSYLTSVLIPTSINSLPYSLFNYCSGLESLTIPGTIINIGISAFSNCTNLKSLYVLSSTPVNLSNTINVFYNVNKSTCTLYVPFNSKSSYQLANQWGEFENIVEMTTGVLDVNKSDIQISIKGKKLSLSNVELGGMIEVFTVSGLKIKEQIVTDTHTEICLETGVFIVKIGNYSEKIVIL